MQELLIAYHGVLAGWVALGAVVMLQVIVGDVAGMRSRHVPGMPVTSGHDDFLFRATRTLANSNEQLPLFLLLSITAVLLGATPRWVTLWVWVFALARALFTLCYYADWRTARSTAFAVGLLGQGGLLGVCLLTLL